PSNNSFHNALITLNITVTNTQLDESYYNITNESNDLVDSNINTSIGVATYNWVDDINFSNTTFPDGNYSLNIYANDTVGNIATDSINITVDKTNPSLSNFNVSPTTINVNSTITFSVNITDAYLNTSSIYIQSNFSGSDVNYSLVLESGDKYNFTFNGTNNLSNQENVSYVFHAMDNAGNLNTSDTYSFFVDNRNISLANITAPANNTVLESGNATTFSVTATDPDSDTLTYSWEFGDGTTSTSQNPSKTFNNSATYTAYVNVSDSYGSVNTTSVTIVINDTTAPTTSSITYESELHIESEGADYFVNGSFFDYSGIFNSSLFYNDTTQTDSCVDSNTSWVCTWNLTNLTVGSYSFTTNVTDNFSTKHTNSTTYSFTVTSCSDSTENGDESGTDCGGSCSAACAVAESGGSGGSGGGSGGGGGGGGGAISTSSDIESSSDTSSSTSTSGGGVSTALSTEILSTVGDELGTSKLNVIEEGKSSGSSAELSAVTSAIDAVKDKESKKIVEEIQRTVEKKLVNKLDVSKSLVTYRVEDPVTKNAIFRSKTYLTFTASEDLSNVNIIEVIPKEVAMYASTITFPNEKPVILEEDPVVHWHFDSIASGETKELSYIVKKKVTEITSTTIGTTQTKKLESESKPLDLTFIKDIVSNKILWIVVGSILIIIAIIFIILRFRKEDEF
ncbi:PKD domain-containing protein, partial [Candidatus Woesearchaeota archaeon]|nr:PKD domain-containing protein [Candidatus Woesearchaeota archaeon]